MVTISPETAYTIASFLFVFICLAAWKIFKKFTAKRDTILIVGLPESGKTQLFSRLVRKDNGIESYGSIKENIFSGIALNQSQESKIVDYPGALRLRTRLFDTWLTTERSSLKGICLVVDALTYQKKARDIAEIVYDIIVYSKKSVPIFIACNEQNDKGICKSAEVIFNGIQNDLGLINKSRQASLETTDGEDKVDLLSENGESFKWADLGGLFVSFGKFEIGETLNLTEVTDWMSVL
uniref:Signal recognition particle receptor subunit beta n=1 Tax=Rhabditophanes sp. KR3021 TaxID=114890 RepID=A0AC35UF54_9BILA